MNDSLKLLDIQDVDGGEGVLHRRAILGPHPTDWDPFILWGYDRFERGAFSWHPHKGFETVTLVLSGRMEHKDSRGGHGILGPGDVQWMTAGKGVMHAEEPVDPEASVLQLWLNLPAGQRAAEPSVQDISEQQTGKYFDGQLTAHVYGGRLGDVQGPADQHHEALFATIEVVEGRGVLPLKEGCRACLYVLNGTLSIGGVTLAAGQGILLSGPCEARADGSGRAALIAAMPLREPVVLHFPFVLDHESEVASAFAALEAGEYGKPW